MHTTRPGQTPPPLPDPDPAAKAHSDRVAARLRREVETAGGRITFARYMQIALYEPGLGYYSAGLTKFGAAGDFTTAPELSPAFSRCIARQCAQVLRAGGGEILEFGAGSGVMARDVLLALEAMGCLPGRYAIVEVSPDLRDRQRRAVQSAAPHLLPRVQWLDAPPDGGFVGVVLANEVVDAFPVHRFRIAADGQLQEDYVVGADGGFAWESGPLSGAAVERALQAVAAEVDFAALGPGYTSEVNLLLGPWIATVARTLSRGMALIIDYGFPRTVYYHPQRRDGTLLCHYRHRAHADPFHLPGLQDITAHVDFTALAEAGAAAGLDVAGYTNQGSFLLAAGIAEGAAAADTIEAMDAAQRIKRLTMPDGMGEVFKVMALTRGFEAPLLGFALRDYRGRL